MSEASLKRWCDQGLLSAVRTPGGHRRLPLQGVVRFVRERRLELVRPSLLGLPALTRREGADGETVRRAMQTALKAADEDEIRRLLLGPYLAGKPAAEVLDELFTPAFWALGEKWTHGDLAIYEERRAVELCARLLHQLRMFLPTPPPDAPQAIGGTLTGDPYELPTAMLEIALCEAGWRAQSYRCGLPAATLVDALRVVRPRLLWLSVSALESEQQFISDCATLYAAAQELGVAVLLGGRMLTADLRDRIQYSAYGDKLRHAVAFVQALHPSARSRVAESEGQR